MSASTNVGLFTGDLGVQTLLGRLAEVESAIALLKGRVEEAEQGRVAAEARERQVAAALDANQLVLDGLQRHLETASDLARIATEAGRAHDLVRELERNNAELRAKLRKKSRKRTS